MRTTLLALLLLPAAAAAQEASPYLPLSHWAMPYIEHLIAAGRIVDPSPLSRPFKVEPITRALDGVDSAVVTGAEWSVVKQIRKELERRMRGPSSRLDLDVSTRASSHARRDPLREAGPGHATYAGSAGLTLYFGPAPQMGSRLSRKERPRDRGTRRRSLRQRAVAPRRAVLRQRRPQLGTALRRRPARPAERVQLRSPRRAHRHRGRLSRGIDHPARRPARHERHAEPSLLHRPSLHDPAAVEYVVLAVGRHAHRRAGAPARALVRQYLHARHPAAVRSGLAGQ